MTDDSEKNTRGAKVKGKFRIFRSMTHWRGMTEHGDEPRNREQRRELRRLKPRQSDR